MKKITKIKAKFYSKEILKYLLLVGAVGVAASSPYFIPQLIKNIGRQRRYNLNKIKSANAFSYLKRRGLIEVERDGHDVHIALTGEGKKRAGKYQIDDLEIKKPKRWDKKWRVVIFDVPHGDRVKRNAFRYKLKNFGFYSLQKSVWIYPFDCKGEIKLLREFFGLNDKQIQTLLVEKMEKDWFLKKFFKLS
ncbi:MAG: hypothetical protein AAB959_00225 [Patescibacteria group bacterium]